jgi:hypothetical protein
VPALNAQLTTVRLPIAPITSFTSPVHINVATPLLDKNRAVLMAGCGAWDTNYIDEYITHPAQSISAFSI